MNLKGDCIEVMKAIKPNSVDAIVTDPPYQLHFMGRSWDKADVVKDHRFCAWLAGFADGEGNFDIHRQVRNGKEYYYCRFEITLREDDSSILELIKKRIGGKVYYHSNKCRLEFVAKSEYMQLTSIFEQFPLQAKKKRDFNIWKEALKISVDNHGTSRPELMKPYWMKLRALRENKGIDELKKDFDYGGDFHYRWLMEAYRALKPGGSLLAMGGSRTSHRLACAIEDVGFVIKDTIMYLYGSGFPKAQDLGKMIDKRMGKEREILGVKVRPNGTTRPNAHKWSHAGMNEGWQRPWRENEEIKKYNNSITTPATELAKHWDGFKVGGIKPAYESIIWAVRPPEGSYVDNVLKWGVGAVNVDECRVGYQNEEIDFNRKQKGHTLYASSGIKEAYRPVYETDKYKKANIDLFKKEGRFPANVILSHHPECVQVGMKDVKGNQRPNFDGTVHPAKGNIYGKYKTKSYHLVACNSYGLETVESWDCHPDCPIRLLDEQSGVLRGSHGTTGTGKGHSSGNIYPKNLGGKVGANYPDTNSGGASRFFYCAKASRGERNAGLEGMEEKEGQAYRSIRKNRGKGYPESTRISNNHPTVKPIKLFEYLIKLVTREGQIVLDPFIGSGTTAIAAHNTGRKCIGIEKEGEYLEITKRRIAYWQNQPKQNSLNLGE